VAKSLAVRRRSVLFGRLAMTTTGLAQVASAPVGAPTVLASSAAVITRVPDRASAFVQAIQQGDESGAEQLASPLYQQEWERRRISLADRARWLPVSLRSGPDGPIHLDLRFAAGLIDQDGLLHLLYEASSASPGGGSQQTVWRVDADEAGRAIWAEMVWLFSTAKALVTSVSDSSPTVRNSLPPALHRMRPDVVVAVRVAATGEGYYAVRHQPLKDDGTPAFDQPVVNFLAIDEDGEVRPGAWSYHPRS
jgi:hypothetical protein